MLLWIEGLKLETETDTFGFLINVQILLSNVYSMHFYGVLYWGVQNIVSLNNTL